MAITRVQSATLTGPDGLPEPNFAIGPENPMFTISLPFTPIPGNVLIAFGGEEPGGGAFGGSSTDVGCDPTGLTGAWNAITAFTSTGNHLPGISTHLVESGDGTDWDFGRCNPITPLGTGRNPTTRLTVVEYSGIGPFPITYWNGIPPVSTSDEFGQTLTPGIVGELLYLACSPWLPSSPDFGFLSTIDSGQVLSFDSGTSFGRYAGIAERITSDGSVTVPPNESSMSIFAFGPPPPPVGSSFPFISYWQICAAGASASRTIFGWVCEPFTTDGGDTITLPGPFLPNSTSISLAGYRQRRGIDYSESPSAGTVTFASAPATDIVGEACYFSVNAAATPPAPGIPAIPPGTGTVLHKDFSTSPTLYPFVKQTYPNDHPGDPMIPYGLFDNSMVSIHDGYMELRAVRQLDDSWLQGLVATFNDDGTNSRTFDFQFGTVSWAAQMNLGPGAWPATWMLDKFASDAEIDWVEPIDEMLTANVHGSDNDGQFASETPFPDTEWHIYTTVWTSTDITFKIDGTTVGTCTGANITERLALLADCKLGPSGSPPDGTTPDTLFLRIAWVTVD